MSSRLLAVICWLLYLSIHVGEPAVATAQSRRPAWTTSKIKGSPEPPAPYRLIEAFPKIRFDHPTSIEQFPGGGPLIVTEMSGKVYSLAKGGKTLLLGDLAAIAGGGVSLFDAELSPAFNEKQDSRHLYLSYVHPTDGTRVSRFTLATESNEIEAGSERVVITWPAGGHNGGCLEFGKDGFLYISTGDGSGPNPPDGLTAGQDVTNLFGAILRIDVETDTGEAPYKVPVDNPFADGQVAGARPEIWAYGLRNPWKFGVDPQSGEIFAADNGWETWEAIHKIERGGNCGWPIMEGRAVLRGDVPRGPTPIVPPVKDHSHTEANSVVGGAVYRGAKLPELAGSFVYGDYITGTIWAIAPAKDGAYSHQTLVDTDQRIVAFHEGAGGELYVLDYDLTGAIYELVPSDAKDTSAEFPRKLSETGLFKSLAPLTPAPGVSPYNVVAPRWVDGAEARRFVALPGDERVTLATGDEKASFPEGAVLVKHLTLPMPEGKPSIPLETQILHFEEGSWRPYSYLWDDAGKDAVLAPSIGASRPIQAPEPLDPDKLSTRTWHVNAVNECKLCHNAESGGALGFNMLQLDRASRSSGPPRQLTNLAAQGILATSPTNASQAVRLVDPVDETASLDDRARSYLHANCSMCHQPGGNAIVSFYLRRDLPFEKLNTNKGTGIGTFGLSEARVIASGDPYRSLLLYRMAKLGYARMPYIGSRVVDGAGVALIDRWLRSLEGGERLSSPLAPDSAEALALKQLTSNASEGERHAAIEALVKTSPGALALASLTHAGALSEGDRRFAATIGAAQTKSDVRGLFETFLPESQRRATLGAGATADRVLANQGDRERGKLIFFSDGARCRNCHEIGDAADAKEKSLGPTLDEIAKKYPERGELIKHILEPSLKIEEPVAAWLAITDDGRQISGLLVEQTDDAVTIKTAEKQLVRLDRANIEELRKSDKSLMPERILSDLTAQEAADLVEYIRSQAK